MFSRCLENRTEEENASVYPVTAALYATKLPKPHMERLYNTSDLYINGYVK